MVMTAAELLHFKVLTRQLQDLERATSAAARERGQLVATWHRRRLSYAAIGARLGMSAPRVRAIGSRAVP